MVIFECEGIIFHGSYERKAAMEGTRIDFLPHDRYNNRAVLIKEDGFVVSMKDRTEEL